MSSFFGISAVRRSQTASSFSATLTLSDKSPHSTCNEMIENSMDENKSCIYTLLFLYLMPYTGKERIRDKGLKSVA